MMRNDDLPRWLLIALVLAGVAELLWLGGQLLHLDENNTTVSTSVSSHKCHVRSLSLP